MNDPTPVRSTTCRNCDTQTNPTARFCPRCGARTADRRTDPAHTPNTYDDPQHPGHIRAEESQRRMSAHRARRDVQPHDPPRAPHDRSDKPSSDRPRGSSHDGPSGARGAVPDRHPDDRSDHPPIAGPPGRPHDEHPHPAEEVPRLAPDGRPADQPHDRTRRAHGGPEPSDIHSPLPAPRTLSSCAPRRTMNEPSEDPARSPDSPRGPASPAQRTGRVEEPTGYALDIRTVGGERLCIPIDDPVTIGSGPCDISMPGDPHLSRLHARIEPTDGGLGVTDLNSTNGVYIRVRGPIVIKAGDELLVGSSRVRIVKHPGEEPPCS